MNIYPPREEDTQIPSVYDWDIHGRWEGSVLASGEAFSHHSAMLRARECIVQYLEKLLEEARDDERITTEYRRHYPHYVAKE